MRAGIKTGPAGNTFVTVYHYFTGFGRNIGSEYGAGPHTFVAARTGIVNINDIFLSIFYHNMTKCAILSNNTLPRYCKKNNANTGEKQHLIV